MAAKSANLENDGPQKEQSHRGAVRRFIKQAEPGLPIEELCRKGRVGDATLYRWRAKYSDMEVPDARRLREQEAESSKLKKLLAEARLDIYALNTAFGVKR